MYNNVGNKVKVLARVLGILLLLAGIIVFYVHVGADTYSGNDQIGWIALVVGVLGFVSSWFIYAFGQLVDDTAEIRKIMESQIGNSK